MGGIGLSGERYYVRGDLVGGALTLNSVEDTLVAALGAVAYPRGAEAGGVVPDEGGAEHFPTSLTHPEAEVEEIIYITEYVSVGLLLGDSERVVAESLHQLLEVFVGVVVSVVGVSR